MTNLLKKVAGFFRHIDHKISGRIHQADNIVISCILYPFALFFHPQLIWIAFLCVYYFSGQNINFLILYVVGVLLCLLTIFMLKRTLKRQRPVLVETMRKPHHFRKKEKNHSMPSGDAIQAALFVIFLNHLGVPVEYLVLFHIGVCLGRVYYMCHWLADTLIATILGAFIAFYLLGAYEEIYMSEVSELEL